MSEDPIVGKIKNAFNILCDESQPRIFLAVTIDKDFMVNYASFGVDDKDAVNILEHMIEYFKQDGEDTTDEQEDRTIH